MEQAARAEAHIPPPLPRGRSSQQRGRSTYQLPRPTNRRVPHRHPHPRPPPRLPRRSPPRPRGRILSLCISATVVEMLAPLLPRAARCLLVLPIPRDLPVLAGGSGFGVWALGFRVYGIGSRVWGLKFRVGGVGFEI